MLDLLQKYPSAGKIVKDYFLDKMLQSLDDNEHLPEDFKEHVRATGIDDEKIDGIVGNNPRMLFDIFDKYDLFIEISINNNFFCYNIYPRDNDKINPLQTVYKTRKEAEEGAVKDAFATLEDFIANNQTG